MEAVSAWTDAAGASLFRQRAIRFIFAGYAAVAPLFISDNGLMLILAMYFWLICCGTLIEETRNVVWRG